MGYLWLKIWHIIGFVSWFAGIFYIWRLFVYHAESDSVEVKKQLEIMSYRLYKYIMRPAMVVTLLCGTWMLIERKEIFVYQLNYWVWIKLALVGGVLFMHFAADNYRQRLAAGEQFPGKKFRILNEVPTLFLILIVILAVLKDAIFSW